jgi:hypothetical protein
MNQDRFAAVHRGRNSTGWLWCHAHEPRGEAWMTGRRSPIKRPGIAPSALSLAGTAHG